MQATVTATVYSQPKTKHAGLSVEFIGYIVFAGRGHQKIIEVMMLIKIPG